MFTLQQCDLRLHSLTQRENTEVCSADHGRGPRLLCVCVRAGSVAAKLACVEAVARALWTFLVLIGEDFRSQPTWFRVWPITVLNSDADT